MKKGTSIFLFVIYLFSTTEVHQLFKLPVMFEHFSEHQRGDEHITFLNFLSMHYLNSNPKSADYDRDMQLPFKTFGDCLTSVVPVTVPDFGTTLSAPQEFFVQSDFVNKNVMFLSAEFSCNIFQPPRS